MLEACPHCGAELSGLGTYCHGCMRYVSDPPQHDEEAPARNADLRAQTVEPQPGGGRQVLVLPLALSANRMWRSSAGAGKKLIEVAVAYNEGKASWREVMAQLFVNVNVSGEGKQYKKDAASWLAPQRSHLITGDVRLLVTLYFERRAGDLDNKIKTLLDVLQKVVYEDDSQVSELHVVKRYDKAKPRVVVVAEPDDGSTQLDPGATFNYQLEF